MLSFIICLLIFPSITYIDFGEVLTIGFLDAIWGIIILLVLSPFLVVRDQLKPTDGDYHSINIMIYIVHTLFLFYILTDMGLNWYGRNSPEKLEFSKPYFSIIMVIGAFGSGNTIYGFIKALKVFKARHNNPIEYSRTNAACKAWLKNAFRYGDRAAPCFHLSIGFTGLGVDIRLEDGDNRAD